MGSSNLPGFWMSIINDSNIQEQLSSVMAMQDQEERALTLLSRTLFLLIMEIKFERDEALKTSGAIMEVIDACVSCRRKLIAEELMNKTVVNSEALYTEPQPLKDGLEETNTISGALNEAFQQSGSNEQSQENSQGIMTGSEKAVMARKKVELHPSVSQKLKSPVSPCQDVDKDTSIARTQATEEVLVPGTVEIEERDFLVSSPEKTFTTQKEYVSETVDMDGLKPQNVSDMFEDYDEGNTQETHTLTLAAVKCQTPTKWCSPVKSPGESSGPGRGNGKKHLGIPRRDTRHSPSEAKQQETTGSVTQKNQCNDTPQQRDKASPTDFHRHVEFTDDASVDSDNDFKPLSSLRSPTHITPENITPRKNKCNVRRTPEGSPVFRKGGRKKRLSLARTDAKRDIAEALNIQQTRVEVKSPQNKTPSKKGSPDKGQSSPRGRRQQGTTDVFSPQPSPHNISDDLTSPVLFQPFVATSSASMKPPACPSPANQKQGTRGGLERTGKEEKRGVALTRSATSMGTSTPSRRLSLRRHQTVDGRQAGRVSGAGTNRLHLAVSPSDHQQKKMGYRQTKVDNFLNPQTARTKPGGSAARRVFLDDEEALRLAVEESLQLKALVDMGQALDQRKEEGGVPQRMGGHSGLALHQGSRTPEEAQQPNSKSPIRLPNLRPALTSPGSAHSSPKLVHNSSRPACGSPRDRSLHRSPGRVKSAKRNIMERKGEDEERQRRDPNVKVIEKENIGKIRNATEEKREEVEGPGKELMASEKQDKAKTGLKRKAKEEEEEKEEEFASAQQEQKAPAGKESTQNTSPRKRGAPGQNELPPPRKTARHAVFHDSFDVLPQKEEPSFAHQGEVVRKRAARKQLEGWTCKQCKEFYEKAGNTAGEVKDLMNKCSRHRSKHKPLSNTPEGFWNPFFDD